MSTKKVLECGCELPEDYKCDFCDEKLAVMAKALNANGLFGHFCSDECATNAIIISSYTKDEDE